MSNPGQLEFTPGPLLKTVNSPADLKKIPKEKLGQVCAELRQYIIDVVSVGTGHFGASMGAVELTVALHYAYNAPTDQVVWDVGHQAYGHKILTGRRDIFHTNRKYGGLSGFPKRSESEYDTFGVGHSSTSISAALGMAMAAKYKKEPVKVVAVIGDGALTAGLPFEGLNNAGVSDTDLLVILNDNRMGIDPIQGSLQHHLQNLQDKRGSDNIFRAFGLQYFGPIDGHDVQLLTTMLEKMKTISGPKLLHIVTVKGKGYALAEKDQTKWHAPGVFNKETGEIIRKPAEGPQPPKYQDVFGNTIIELAKANPKVMAVTPAMPSGSSLKVMMREMPDRAFDVDIAEQHAVTVSAGMATQGLKVFCNIYSAFMQRGYDQVVHDVAVQNLPVIFCLDRAGVAGDDGPTHHGAYDVAYFRCIPNMIVSAPMNEPELRNLMYTAQLDSTTSPFSIRYPRGEGVTPDWQRPMQEIKIGTGRKIQDGDNIAILTFGHVGNFVPAVSADLTKDNVKPAHYDMRFAKPLDEKLLHEVFKKFKKIITVEDATVIGGFGSAILEFAAQHNYQAQIKILGMPDRVVEHGSQKQLYAECHYDAAAIASAARELSR